MNNRGFTLIELLSVIAIVMALACIGMWDVKTWRDKAQIESATKDLYGDLQDARMRAAFTRRPQGVTLGVNAAGKSRAVFRRYSSESAGGVVTETKNYPFLFQENATGEIRFNTRGVMSGAITKVICATPNVGAAHDALLVEQTITNLGKWTNRGAGCASANVHKK